MKFISTRHHKESVSFESALVNGLASDGGLFVPDSFPHLDDTILTHLPHYALHALGDEMMCRFVNDISRSDLHTIISSALNFPIPLVHLENNLYLLEVFHGPTLAFKDVGARFMANILSHYAVTENKKINIIVATSGDTGSAIAHAFYKMPNIDVFILYPSNKITRLQEQQITTFGSNIHALEVSGTFDDCQRLVKTALADESLKVSNIFTTANSINIARLLPQMIYHAYGVVQLLSHGITIPPTLVIPSGNLGNLTSAVYAKQIGIPIRHFIAAHNMNAVFPEYLQSSTFTPQPSKKTFANAMDVGNPSNFERLVDFYGHNHHRMRHDITGAAIADDSILNEIKRTYEQSKYILDPHTAVGVAAARASGITQEPIIITATAHPAKFPEVITEAIHINMPVPDQLRQCLNKPKQAQKISIDYSDLYQTLSKNK